MVSYSRRVFVGWVYAILTGTAGAGNAARVSGTGVPGQHLGPSIEPPVWEGIREGIWVQPRPQGLLAFQYGGGRREDPGTQRTKTIADWCIS